MGASRENDHVTAQEAPIRPGPQFCPNQSRRTVIALGSCHLPPGPPQAIIPRMPDAEHLKLIQGVINRLAGNSFLLKGWSVTLVAGLSVLARRDTGDSYAWLAAFVVGVFAALDAFYLALERAYRRLYDATVLEDKTSWSMKAQKVNSREWLKSLCSVTVLPLYIAMLMGALLMGLTP